MTPLDVNPYDMLIDGWPLDCVERTVVGIAERRCPASLYHPTYLDLEPDVRTSDPATSPTLPAAYRRGA